MDAIEAVMIRRSIRKPPAKGYDRARAGRNNG